MGNVVIVAIPREDDLVWDISSEKVPHMTLLYLGDENKVQNLSSIVEFVEHAANTVLERFYLSVDKRGELGPDKADVLFFANEDSWDLPVLKQFRTNLLQDHNIRTAYDSAQQFPEWQPHLTLGYPKDPAGELEQGQRIWDVCFDRIAVWTGDFEGPEFDLKRHKYAEVAMSDVIGEILSHHGVKGMRWGRRKSEGTSAVTITTKKGKVKLSGGHGLPAHPDAVSAAVAKQKLVKSGAHALSNKELQDLGTRLNLEQSVAKLSTTQKASNPGKKFVVEVLSNVAKQQATKVANDAASKQVAKLLKQK